MFDELINETAKETNSEINKETNSELNKERILELYDEYVEERLLDLQTDPTVNLDHMALRFSGLVNLHNTEIKSVALVGVGNLGHEMFRILCDIFKNIAIFDDDIIEIQNVKAQGHDLIELGEPKVAVLQRWAMRHCGIRVQAFQTRVNDLDDFEDYLDHMPDIIITGVDNMETRNGLLGDLIRRACQDGGAVPELFIDMRMGAGQWSTFILPVFDTVRTGVSNKMAEIIQEHMVFSDEEGEQEECTARATHFTGMNAASYVGAFLTWYSNNPTFTFDSLINFYMQETKGEPPFKFREDFDSMGWEFILPRPSDIEKNTALRRAQEHNEVLSGAIATMTEHISSMQQALLHTKNLYTRDDYGDKIIELVEPGDIAFTEGNNLVTVDQVREGLYSDKHSNIYLMNHIVCLLKQKASAEVEAEEQAPDTQQPIPEGVPCYAVTTQRDRRSMVYPGISQARMGDAWFVIDSVVDESKVISVQDDTRIEVLTAFIDEIVANPQTRDISEVAA